MSAPSPARPVYLPPLAQACLTALAERGLGHALSLGGALGLAHYVEFRRTHDADAWWQPGVTRAVREPVVATIEEVLRPHGDVRVRAWGDVTSVELLVEGRLTFSFQIAERSALLREPAPAPWADFLLDSLPDLIASKMVALVERGAPRDFRDIDAVCRTGLASPADCWRYWRQRQHLAGSDTDAARARCAILTHLERISQHRPLDRIADRQARAEAARVRAWFREVFVHVAP